ncbi:fibrinogen-like YCDxxxxGGGW domain-containing protein [Nocardioides sp. CCNWLW239]|uniref:fibrinogen-like YCDxxxxGGGW domain-containing protein n=1 Tax=Nocardioides sp. CCNWLW239 TaxID=3128902 RepID=UPI0030185BE4
MPITSRLLRARRAAVSALSITLLGGFGFQAASAQATVPVTTALPANPAAPPSALGPIGSETNPAASCWEVKQDRPDAPSGNYWLWTPDLVRADQFHCDQETDGGGWVLIGRGRDGWSHSSTGQGTVADVRDVIDGPEAFAPRTLPVDTVNGLLGGKRVDEQTVRLRRAVSADGSKRQEVRFRYAQARPGWSWQLETDLPVADVLFDGTVAGSGTAASFKASGSVLYDVHTTVSSTSGWRSGWGIRDWNNGLGGTTSSSNYLYKNGGEVTRPFTQVFLRPELDSDDFPAPPQDGTPEVTGPAVASSASKWNPWGVTGLSPGSDTFYDVEVQAFAEGDGVMYVGGNFTTIQRSSSGTDTVEQPYLAAFDIDTGEWIPTFRPKLNGQVRALAVLDDNRLAVGGTFTQASGMEHHGLVVLDTTVGQVDPYFTTTLANYVGGQLPSVRSMDVADGWLYIGGLFTHATNEKLPDEVYGRNLMRLSVADLTPDRALGVELNGSVWSLDASDDGERLYAAGMFSVNGTESAYRGLAIDLDDLSQVPWKVAFSDPRDGNTRQQAVVAAGDSVWITGAEHILSTYDAATMELRQTWVQQAGGDGQTLATDGETVYAGCHCSENTYEGSSSYASRVPGTVNHGAIEQIGAFDNAGATIQPAFSPRFSTRQASGAWESLVDSNGTLWVGGDLTQAARDSLTKRWTGGFARFAATDTTAPDKPADLKVVTDGASHVLTWSGTGGKGVTYQVLRNGRPVGTAPERTLTVPATDGAQYVVRAIDAADNASPSTAVESAVAAPVLVVPNGAQWDLSYGHGTPRDWPAVGSLDTYGPAPLGWGTADVATEIPAATDGTRPITSYYARAFEVPDPAATGGLEVTVRVDDGVAVYLNGTEIVRENLPAGALTENTYASSAVSSSSASTSTVTVVVPRDLLTTGTNVLTAEAHSNYRKTASQTFELSAALAVR